MSFIENLNWRYATKKFDTSKKVSEEDKDKIFEAIRMAPTSFGFQPFQIQIIENKEIREELKKAAYNQAQITDASFLLVFSARSDIENRIDEYAELIKINDPVKADSLKNGGLRETYDKQSADEKAAWAAKQAYIALGFGLAACIDLKIDSCPMEGFSKDEFKKILNLPENLFPQAVLAVGYRLEPETPQKYRFSKENIRSLGFYAPNSIVLKIPVLF